MARKKPAQEVVETTESAAPTETEVQEDEAAQDDLSAFISGPVAGTTHHYHEAHKEVLGQ